MVGVVVRHKDCLKRDPGFDSSRIARIAWWDGVGVSVHKKKKKVMSVEADDEMRKKVCYCFLLADNLSVIMESLI